MNIDSRTRDDKGQIVLGLLHEVAQDNAISQRTLAQRLGVALGIANATLARCVKKGLIKVSQAPANRYLYYLTPAGFSEKSRLTAEYLSQSFGFFRTARDQCQRILTECRHRQLSRIALAGSGDLADIVVMCATGEGVEIVGAFDARLNATSSSLLTVFERREQLPDHDAVVIVCLHDAADLHRSLVEELGAERVLVPPLLMRPVQRDTAEGSHHL